MEILIKTTYFTLISLAKIKKSDNTTLARMWSHRDTYTLLVSMYTGTTSLKNNLTITSEVENVQISQAVNSTFCYTP